MAASVVGWNRLLAVKECSVVGSNYDSGCKGLKMRGQSVAVHGSSCSGLFRGDCSLGGVSIHRANPGGAADRIAASRAIAADVFKVQNVQAAAQSTAVPFPFKEKTESSAPTRRSDSQTSSPGEDVETLLQKKRNEADKMKKWIEEIREMFRTMTSGQISESPYDTAWVALIPASHDSNAPQFPRSLQWIVNNQFSDGSWGNPDIFTIYDRICNTLACIISLRTWAIGSDAVEKGQRFIQRNLKKMSAEEPEHMLIGFEIVYPSLLERAKELGLDLPYEDPVNVKINAEREKKLTRIPMEVLHNYPTTALHSLEGLRHVVDWDKLMKLQSKNGSFLFSPASTACAYMHTKNPECLKYLTDLLQRFNDAVPNVYPVDMFEHLWIVDRLERLGISRYFEKEIKDCLDYVYKYWTNHGIGWASDSTVQDIDDTSMGFRLLRLHGYDVSPDCFKQFRGKNGDFFCFAGQSGQAVTGMLNFYRATQTMFPGETILEEGRKFARRFLEDKHAKSQCNDKWIITKNGSLAAEVGYSLNFPWYTSLPRVETRSYMEQYSADDIWIGKTLYRMPLVTNRTFLDLAKADFNLCQGIHQRELQQIASWNNDCGFGRLQFARQKALECYFASVAIMEAPELAPARLVWGRSSVLTTVIDDFFDVGGCLAELRQFYDATCKWNISSLDTSNDNLRLVFLGLYNSVNEISQEAYFSQGRDIGHHLRYIWNRWFKSCLTQAEWTELDFVPSFDEYMSVAEISIALEPIVWCTMFFLGETVSDTMLASPELTRLMQLVSRVGRLLNDVRGFQKEEESSASSCNAVTVLMRNTGMDKEDSIRHCYKMVDESMNELSHQVYLPNSSVIPKSIRMLHFNMARTLKLFYKRSDEFSTPSNDMKNILKRVFLEPVV